MAATSSSYAYWQSVAGAENTGIANRNPSIGIDRSYKDKILIANLFIARRWTRRIGNIRFVKYKSRRFVALRLVRCLV